MRTGGTPIQKRGAARAPSRSMASEKVSVFVAGWKMLASNRRDGVGGQRVGDPGEPPDAEERIVVRADPRRHVQRLRPGDQNSERRDDQRAGDEPASPNSASTSSLGCARMPADRRSSVRAGYPASIPARCESGSDRRRRSGLIVRPVARGVDLIAIGTRARASIMSSRSRIAMARPVQTLYGAARRAALEDQPIGANGVPHVGEVPLGLEIADRDLRRPAPGFDVGDAAGEAGRHERRILARPEVVEGARNQHVRTARIPAADQSPARAC